MDVVYSIQTFAISQLHDLVENGEIVMRPMNYFGTYTALNIELSWQDGEAVTCASSAIEQMQRDRPLNVSFLV